MSLEFKVEAICCPFCGSKRLEFGVGAEDREGVPTWIGCVNCGACGPWVYVEKDGEKIEVMKEWNKRFQEKHTITICLTSSA